MKEIRVIEFSEYPGARYKHLGPHSGEAFRDDVILPAIKSGKDIYINFDGVFGYGSSFLEEVFGGLIRLGVDKSLVRNIVSNSISNDDPDIIDEISSYVEDAITERSKQ